MKLSGEEFIRRFLLHVLPKAFAKSVTMEFSHRASERRCYTNAKSHRVNSSQIQIRGT
ncbi:MAG: hypothetical protein IPP38_00120 [Bacteroidetes bacterium]|nr:hypothetical protein [Bacteroidota bacterium]